MKTLKQLPDFSRSLTLCFTCFSVVLDGTAPVQVLRLPSLTLIRHDYPHKTHPNLSWNDPPASSGQTVLQIKCLTFRLQYPNIETYIQNIYVKGEKE